MGVCKGFLHGAGLLMKRIVATQAMQRMSYTINGCWLLFDLQRVMLSACLTNKQDNSYKSNGYQLQFNLEPVGLSVLRAAPMILTLSK